MRVVAASVIGLVLAAASTPVSQHSPEAQAKLDKLLEGRVPGKTKTCLPVNQTNHPIAIDDLTMLFLDGRRLWRTELRGSMNCGRIDPQSTIVTESGWRVCAGDKLVFLHEGEAEGACYLGEFTPYAKP